MRDLPPAAERAAGPLPLKSLLGSQHEGAALHSPIRGNHDCGFRSDLATLKRGTLPARATSEPSLSNSRLVPLIAPWLAFWYRLRSSRPARGTILLAASLAVTLAAVWPAAAAPYQFTSAEGSYSLAFPAGPQEEINESETARSVLNALNHDNGYFAVVHVDHKFDPKPTDELEGNINKFTQQFNAPTQTRKKRKFTRAAGDQLPAEEFTFENEELKGKGIVIVDGRRTYMITAFALKPHDRQAAIDRFMKSFKLKVAPVAQPQPQKLVKGKAKP